MKNLNLDFDGNVELSAKEEMRLEQGSRLVAMEIDIRFLEHYNILNYGDFAV